MLAPSRAAAPPDEVLPPVLPPIDSKSSYSAADIENDAILSAWLVEQTKRGKQAKKVDPELCCPILLTTFTMDARQIQIKKKRKKTAAKKRKSKIVEALEEELDEEDEDELDVEHVEAVPEDIDVVLYDDEIPLGQQHPIENDEIDLDEEEEADEIDDSEEEVDDGDEGDVEDIEENEDEPHDPSVHSVEESDDDDSD